MERGKTKGECDKQKGELENKNVIWEEWDGNQDAI